MSTASQPFAATPGPVALPWRPAGKLTGWILLAPTLAFLLLCFAWPVLQMMTLSFTAQVVDGNTVKGLTLANYTRLFSTDLYFRILARTLRIAASASALSVVLAYPLAIAIARGGPMLSRLVTITVVAPLA